MENAVHAQDSLIINVYHVLLEIFSLIRHAVQLAYTLALIQIIQQINARPAIHHVKYVKGL